MTGPRGGVIGVKREQAIERFLTLTQVRFETSKEDPWLNAVLIEGGEGGLATSIDPAASPRPAVARRTASAEHAEQHRRCAGRRGPPRAARGRAGRSSAPGTRAGSAPRPAPRPAPRLSMRQANASAPSGTSHTRNWGESTLPSTAKPATAARQDRTSARGSAGLRAASSVSTATRAHRSASRSAPTAPAAGMLQAVGAVARHVHGVAEARGRRGRTSALAARALDLHRAVGLEAQGVPRAAGRHGHRRDGDRRHRGHEHRARPQGLGAALAHREPGQRRGHGHDRKALRHHRQAEHRHARPRPAVHQQGQRARAAGPRAPGRNACAPSRP